MIGQVTVAQATAVGGYDLFRDQTWRVSSRTRKLRGLGFCGSAVAGDCYADLYVDQFHVGRFYNLDLAWPTKDQIIPLKGNLVPPGATIALIMGVQPTTNAINVILE